jgi:hypothetical protein
LIQRKDKKQIQDGIDKTLSSSPFNAEKIQNWIFDKQNGKSRAGKYNQDHHYLKKAVKLPLGLQTVEKVGTFSLV